MMYRCSLRRAGLLALLMSAQGVVSLPAEEPRWRQLLQACEVEGVASEALCGTYEVWEDRARASGRKVSLKIVMVPAREQPAAAAPLVWLDGGPGAAASRLAAAFSQLPELRAWDVLLVDSRGTGDLGTLHCPTPEQQHLSQVLGDWLPLPVLPQCLREVQSKADPTLYTTPAIADDLNEVRQWLGFERLNLMGGSGGTLTGLSYLRRHGHSVRSAAFTAAASDAHTGPWFFARHAQQALDRLLDDCASSPECRQAFPKPRDDLRRALARFDQGPVQVTLPGPTTGEPETAAFHRHHFSSALRRMLYTRPSAVRIPLTLHKAAAGDFRDAAQFLVQVQMGDSSLATGVYLTQRCSEAMAFPVQETEEQLTAGTFLGDYMIRQHREACEIWPRGELPEDHFETVRSSVPVLLLSGWYDSSTPPSAAHALLEGLPNGRHVVFRYAHHGPGLTTTCGRTLVADFFRAGTTFGLDTACASEGEGPEFQIEDPS